MAPGRIPFFGRGPIDSGRLLNIAVTSNLAAGTAWSLAHNIRAAIKSLHRKVDQSESPENAPEYIYAPHGSAMLFRASFFELGGDLTFRSFLYGEEQHVAEQVRRVGLKVVWLPGLNVKHFAGTTTSLIPPGSRLRWEFESNLSNYKRYYKGIS